MFKAIEDFFAAYQHTVEAFGALSTFLAVVVSLWLASRSSRTRLKAHLSISVIMGTAAPTPPKFLTLGITNTGVLPLDVPFSHFAWRLPFRRRAWIVSPMDHFAGHGPVPRRKYPFEIGAKKAATVFLSDISTFEAMARKMWREASWFDRFRFRWVWGHVGTDDGAVFKAKIGKDVRKLLREFVAKERAAG